MGEPELFDDVLSAASQVNTREADTRTREPGRGRGDGERRRGMGGSQARAHTRNTQDTTHRAHGWRGGDMRQTCNNLDIEADIEGTQIRHTTHRAHGWRGGDMRQPFKADT